MKQVVLLKHLSFFETTAADAEARLDERNLKVLYDELKTVFDKHGMKLAFYETAQFPMEKLSIQHCEECSQLMVNRDLNPAKFGGSDHFLDQDDLILDGGTYKGRNLCEECLPVSHRWGHFS